MTITFQTTPEAATMAAAIIVMLREGMISHKKFDELTGNPGNAESAMRNVECAIRLQMKVLMRDMN
jgi:hypothetical protein